MFYFDKQNPNVLYVDIREEDLILCDGRKLKIKPDEIVDFRSMPYKNKSFNLVIFDPPHLKTLGKTSWMAKKYGVLSPTWEEDISKGFSECWRVLKKGGTLIFKWNEAEIKLKQLISCFPIKPLMGHTTTTNLKTKWLVFYKE